MILQALQLSLLVASVSTLLVAVLGTLAGWTLARSTFRGRELLDALLSLPLVLPPTVTGYVLLVLLGRQGALGGALHAAGIAIPFTWIACVVAASVMAFPLMHRTARIAFEAVDPRHALAAATLGHGRTSTLLLVSIPLARRGLLAGVALAFARAVGEFGATLLLAGNTPGRTQTLTLAIYDAAISGEDRTALVLSLLLTATSVVVLLVTGRLGRTAP